MLAVCYRLSVGLSGSQEQPSGAGQLPEVLHRAVRDRPRWRMENGNLSPSWIRGMGR